MTVFTTESIVLPMVLIATIGGLSGVAPRMTIEATHRNKFRRVNFLLATISSILYLTSVNISSAHEDAVVAFGQSTYQSDLDLAQKVLAKNLDPASIYVSYIQFLRIKIIRIIDNSCINSECTNLVVFEDINSVLQIESLPSINYYAGPDGWATVRLNFTKNCEIVTLVVKNKQPIEKTVTQTGCK